MSLVFDDFSDRVGQTFVLLGASDAPHALVLEEAELSRHQPANPAVRRSFSLIFLSHTQEVLPQDTYRLEHPAFEALELFIVPIGRDARGVSYQATFN